MSEQEFTPKNYIGGIIENDIETLHSASVSRTHFEAFKMLLRKHSVYYKIFDGSHAQILDIDGKKRVYFTGGTTWWGFQQSAVKKMMACDPKLPCYLLIYASKNPHYWWIDLSSNNITPDKGRWLFSEATEGKLSSPKGFTSAVKLLNESALINKIKEV